MNLPYRGAVIFDGDGVIFDTHALHNEVGRACAAELGIKALDVHSGDVREIFSRLDLGGAAYKRYIEIFEAHELRRGIHVFPFVNQTLFDLRMRGFMTGIFTNRKLRQHNHEVFSASGLDYNLLDFFMMHLGNSVEFDTSRLTLLSTYLPAPFAKPIGLAALRLFELIQDIPNAPDSVYMVGDNATDLEFARRNNFAFIGTLSGTVKSYSDWLRLGAAADKIVPDVKSLLHLLPLSPFAGRT